MLKYFKHVHSGNAIGVEGLQCLLLIHIQLPVFVCRSRLVGGLTFISRISITYQ